MGGGGDAPFFQPALQAEAQGVADEWGQHRNPPRRDTFSCHQFLDFVHRPVDHLGVETVNLIVEGEGTPTPTLPRTRGGGNGWLRTADGPIHQTGHAHQRGRRDVLFAQAQTDGAGVGQARRILRGRAQKDPIAPVVVAENQAALQMGQPLPD